MTSDPQKASRSVSASLLAVQVSLGIGTCSGIILTNTTGEIVSKSFTITLTTSLSVTAAEARYPCGGLTVATRSQINASLERRYGYGGKPCNMVLRQVGSQFRLMRSCYDLISCDYRLLVVQRMCLSMYWLHTTVLRQDRSRGKMMPKIIFIIFVNLRTIHLPILYLLPNKD